MNDYDRRRYEMLVRVVQFFNDNTADFVGFVRDKFLEIVPWVNEVESKSAAFASGIAEAGQQFEVKDTARENLRASMSAMSLIAKSMEYEFDGISDKFRFAAIGGRNLTIRI